MKIKGHILKIGFFLSLFLILTSGTKQENILGRWEVYKLIRHGKTKKITGDVGEMWLEMQPDGILILGKNSGSRRGEWHLDEKNDLLYIAEKKGTDAEKMHIKKLTATKLILSKTKSSGKDRIFMNKVHP